jgi:hypothetical protein
VKIFNIIDDHSRVRIRSRAVLRRPPSDRQRSVRALQQSGMPAGVLSDNGMCFSGKLRGFEVLFSESRDAGIRPITGRPFHPDHRQSRTVPADSQEMAPSPTAGSLAR